MRMVKAARTALRAAPLILLASSALLTALLGWRALQAAASHRALAQRVLEDYAKLAAAEFSRRTTAFVGHYGIAVLIRAFDEATRAKLEPPSREQLRALIPPQSQRAVELVGSTFLLDAQTSHFVCGETLLPASTRDAITRAVRDGNGTDFRSVTVTAEGQMRLYVVAPRSGGERGSWFGFEVPLASVVAWMDEFVAREPLLPSVLASDELVRSALIAVVRAPDGSELYRHPSQAPVLAPLAKLDLAGEPPVTALDGFTVEVAIEPSAAPRLVIGGLPRSQARVLFALTLLSASLAALAALQIMRERRHARLREDFVTRASHELRTPVSRIRMFTETLLLDRVRSDLERRQALRALDRGARRLSMLIDNVLQLSRRRSETPLHVRQVDVRATVGDIVADFVTSVDANSRVTFSCSGESEAKIDPDVLRQVLLNLLDNAWKYSGPEPKILVAVDAQPGTLIVTVEDNGPGIPKRDRRRIWEPYVRLDRDRRSSVAGTGIGLAVVRDLVRRHHGTYRVEAGAQGSRFVITLATEASTEDRGRLA
jgi:signal transduction histidine kinase